MDYCYRQEISHIHLDTPGPIGLTGLIIARILKLPVTGTYHEITRELSEFLSEDEFTEDLVWKYRLWFYSQMNDIYVISSEVKEELRHRGIEPEKIQILPSGQRDRRTARSDGSMPDKKKDLAHSQRELRQYA